MPRSTSYLESRQADDLAFDCNFTNLAHLESLQGLAHPSKWELTIWKNSKDLSLESLKGKVAVLGFVNSKIRN